MTRTMTTLLARATRTVHRPARELATPPADSTLRPVLGDPGLPIAGHTFEAFEDLLALHRRQYELYGPVFWTRLAGRDVVMAVGPDAVGQVLSHRSKTFAGSGWEQFLEPFFRRGILLMDSDEHLYHRRTLQQAFTRPRLIGYLETMTTTIDHTLTSWAPDTEFMSYPAVKRLTLQIASQVFMGEDLDAQSQDLRDAFTAAVQATLSVVRHDVPGGKWRAGLRGRKTLEDFFRAKLPQARANPGTDLFSVLCNAQADDGAEFGDDDIINHMIFLMMAAHDTTTTTVSMMIYNLAAHREWQDRVRQESEALGRNYLTYDDIDKLPSLDLVFKESLRLCSPVGALARKTTEDTELLGHFIPKGTLVGAAVSSGHRMEPWWRDPDTFDPNRFAEDNREDKAHRHQFTPFGGGVHKCIGMYFGGMEAKSILHRMLLDFEWSVPQGYSPRMGYLTGPYPADGLPIVLRRRTRTEEHT